jgi:hypothetical protein
MKGWQCARSLLTMFLMAAEQAACTFLQHLFNFYFYFLFLFYLA